MGNWSITPLATVMVASRIDGEYYLPEYITNEEALKKIKTAALPSEFIVSDGNHLSVSKHFCSEGGVPYYRGQDITDFFLENASPVRIPVSVYSSAPMRRSHFRGGDVLLSIVGTIGSLSLVPKSQGMATGSCKIAILRPKGSYPGPFLAAFLLCRFGQLQIRRNTRGAVQLGLILKDLSRIRIPLVSEKKRAEISVLVESAIRQNSSSKVSYLKAQQLLESELGLDRLTLQKPVGYMASLSEVEEFGRADADYFQPKYDQIKKAIMGYKNGWMLMTHCATAITPNIDPFTMPDKLFDYIELADIDPSLGRIKGSARVLGKNLPSRARRIVRSGDVIASAVVGSVDKAALVGNENDGFLASTGFFHFRALGISPEYFLILVRSTLVTMQLEQEATGGILSAVPNARLRRIIIPILENKLQDEISDLVIRAHKAKKESDSLLEKAKTRVEQLIEEAVKS
jgi:restriction endonuclease S subunit